MRTYTALPAVCSVRTQYCATGCLQCANSTTLPSVCSVRTVLRYQLPVVCEHSTAPPATCGARTQYCASGCLPYAYSVPRYQLPAVRKQFCATGCLRCVNTVLRSRLPAVGEHSTALPVSCQFADIYYVISLTSRIRFAFWLRLRQTVNISLMVTDSNTILLSPLISVHLCSCSSI